MRGGVLVVMTAGCLVSAAAAGCAQERAVQAGPSFFNARYASRASSTFYGGYAVGQGFAFIGLVQNPRSDYREAIVGAGAGVRLSRRSSVALGIAAAYATDGWYTQLYLLPALRLGRWEVSGTLEGYLPLSRTGARQFGTSPLNAYLVLSGRMAVGTTWVAGWQRGAGPSHGLGPSLRVGIPRGTVTLDLVRRVVRAPSEVRVTVAARFPS